MHQITISKPFLSLALTSELEVGLTLPAGVGLAGVLGVVEHEHVARRGLGRDHARVLWHVARAVDLALVVDLDLDLDLAGYGAEPTELALLNGVYFLPLRDLPLPFRMIFAILQLFPPYYISLLNLLSLFLRLTLFPSFFSLSLFFPIFPFLTVFPFITTESLI